MYFQICAPSEDLNEPAKTRWPISLSPLGALWIASDLWLLHTDGEDSDQTARMRMLIRVFAERCSEGTFSKIGTPDIYT